MFSQSIYNFKWWHLFFIFSLIYLSLAYLTNVVILTDSFYYSSLGDQLSIDRISEVIKFSKKFQWIGYCTMPILLLIKWFTIAGIIYIGVFLFNQNKWVKFTKVMKHN
jgi:hypothetical protein